MVRRLLVLGVLLTVTFVLTMAGQPASAQPPESVAQAADSTRVAVPEPTAQALSYHRSGNTLWIVGTLWGLIVPAAFLFSGFSARIRTWARRIGRYWFVALGLYFVAFSAVAFVADLPLAYYGGFVREHAYGLSNQTFAKWAQDQVIGLLVGMVVGVLFLWVPFLLLKRSPGRWWFYTGLLAVPFLVLLILVQPLWIDPLFNEFGPMKNQALEADILRLAERSGIEGSRVFEVAKSEDTNAVNAYVTGFGATKRIVLWDTIVAKLSREQLLVVMGHEMGHYVLGHVWKLIAAVSLLIMASLYGVHRASGWLIGRFRNRFGFGELSDEASLPLIILLFSMVSLVVSPAMLALSRHFEHEADRFALEITRDNHAAATAFVTLQQENLAVPRPGALFKFWRASHPPVGERIDFCNDYRPWERGEPLVYGERFK